MEWLGNGDSLHHSEEPGSESLSTAGGFSGLYPHQKVRPLSYLIQDVLNGILTSEYCWG